MTAGRLSILSFAVAAVCIAILRAFGAIPDTTPDTTEDAE